MGAALYLRFILPGRASESGSETGIFAAAGELRSEGALAMAEREELTELLAWFETALTTPERTGRGRSKKRRHAAAGSISWIKDTAVEHVKRLHRLAEILRDHGCHVALIRSVNPGTVVYEDDHQIIAEPAKNLLQRV